MPCININKAELAEVSRRFPEQIDRIEEWEWMVGQASKRWFSTMMADAHEAKDRRKIFAAWSMLEANNHVTERKNVLRNPIMIYHVVSVSGGKDSTATLIHALRKVPEDRIIPIFCDTGNEHPITYQYLDELEKHVGIQITRLKADFSQQILAKRRFIARDERNKREYATAPVFDSNGLPVPKRDGAGNIITKWDKKKNEYVAVQKTKKIGSGRRRRWTNKAKRRALAVMHPSGNPFLDLCMWKGRFPSRKAQFCTQELKTAMAVEFQMELIDQGYGVVSWQGVRRDESFNRRNAKLMERVGKRLWIFRPIVTWTAQQTVNFSLSAGIPLNPLYRQGCGRVGCMPCININKAELAEVSRRFPEQIDRIEEWEWLVGQASKRGFSTMMADAHEAKDRRQIFADLNIRARVRWATNAGAGSTLSLFDEEEFHGGCSSSYGLCER